MLPILPIHSKTYFSITYFFRKIFSWHQYFNRQFQHNLGFFSKAVYLTFNKYYINKINILWINIYFKIINIKFLIPSGVGQIRNLKSKSLRVLHSILVVPNTTLFWTAISNNLEYARAIFPAYRSHNPECSYYFWEYFDFHYPHFLKFFLRPVVSLISHIHQIFQRYF